jgi:hypothetical protein
MRTNSITRFATQDSARLPANIISEIGARALTPDRKKRRPEYSGAAFYFQANRAD